MITWLMFTQFTYRDTMTRVVGRPVVGWYRDPAGPDQFRYWSGEEWTAHATVSESDVGRKCGTWYRGILRNPVVVDVIVWCDRNVPVTRGRLGQFTQPAE
jgi:hypothetical protein